MPLCNMLYNKSVVEVSATSLPSYLLTEVWWTNGVGSMSLWMLSAKVLLVRIWGKGVKWLIHKTELLCSILYWSQQKQQDWRTLNTLNTPTTSAYLVVVEGWVVVAKLNLAALVGAKWYHEQPETARWRQQSGQVVSSAKFPQVVTQSPSLGWVKDSRWGQ